MWDFLSKTERLYGVFSIRKYKGKLITYLNSKKFPEMALYKCVGFSIEDRKTLNKLLIKIKGELKCNHMHSNYVRNG